MPKKLFTFCCRLCLHDGSVSQLLDIYSVKGLDEKMLKVFNVQISSRDCCTTNICFSCLKETLELEQQMMQYQKHKQTILLNQRRLKKNGPVAISGLSPAALNQAQTVKPNQSELTHRQISSVPKSAVKKSLDGSCKSQRKNSEASPSVHQNVSNKNITDDIKQNSIPHANSETVVDKPKKPRIFKNSPGKSQILSVISAASQSSPNVPSAIHKLFNGSHKSKSKHTESSPAVNKQQHTDKQKGSTKKPKDGGLKKQSAAKKNPRTQPTNVAKDKNEIYIKPKKPSTQLHVSENYGKRANTVVPHANADSINPNVTDANITVPNVSDTVPTVEQNTPVHVIDLQRTAAQQSKQQPQTVAAENSSLTAKCSISLPVTVQSQPGIPVLVPQRQRAPSLGVYTTPSIVSLQGGLCTSIPLANISTANLPCESRSVSIASVVNQTGTSNNASTTQGQQIAMPLAYIYTTPGPNASASLNTVSMVNQSEISSNASMTQGQQLAMHLANISATTRSFESPTVSTGSMVNGTGININTPTTQGQQLATPLENVSAAKAPYESTTISTASMVNQPGTSSNASMTQGQQLAMHLANISATSRSFESPTVSTGSMVNRSGMNINTPTTQRQQLATPLENISATTRPYESTTISTASMVNQPGTSSNASTTQGQQLAETTHAQTTSCAVATVGQVDESRNHIINNATSLGAITKRRHSTSIWVSSNLFDEPPEKAQFAMLRKNQGIRNIEQQTNVPPLVSYPYPRLPVLPQGFRTQIVPIPQMTMPFHTFDGNMPNRYPVLNNTITIRGPSIPTVQNNNPTQPIASCTNFGINYGQNLIPRTVNTSTIGQQPVAVSTTAQQSSLAPNSNIRTFHSEYMHSSQVSSNSSESRNNAKKPSNNASEQQIRACYKCNVCSSYYLLESSLTMHLRRIHQLEKSERTYSVVYDPNICSVLMSRIRRKSIADPLQLSNNRFPNSSCKVVALP